MKYLMAAVLAHQAFAWSQNPHASTSRRRFFDATTSTASTMIIGGTAFLVGKPALAAAAAAAADSLVDELKDSKTKLEGIPELLEQQEWEKVRKILKTPPVNKLWNLGESQNTLSKLAKDSGIVDLFELKDELATTIQMCDQLTYDNVFVYYQPGNGKINIKEPVGLAKQAVQQLQRAIDMANE